MGNRPMAHHRMTSLFTRNGVLLPGIVLSCVVGVGGMRGIGWAVLTCDPVSGRLFNVWLDEHDAGFPVGASPLLAMDVFEHADIHDYGMDRSAYVQAFMNTIDWRVVERRFESSGFRPGLAMAVNNRRAG